MNPRNYIVEAPFEVTWEWETPKEMLEQGCILAGDRRLKPTVCYTIKDARLEDEKDGSE